jgi:hypothetical protein
VEIYAVTLWGMPTNHAWLFKDHIDPFLESVLNLLREGRTCNIAGMASKDGTLLVNTRVANLRRDFVLHWLLRKDPRNRLRLNPFDGAILQPASNDQPASKWHGVRIKMGPPGVWLAPDSAQLDS